ncbi:TNF receptor-associated factor family protein DDB_G0290931-like, partial [Actinia tenebrosa]|uniref:TNF receptor-associated factor family protein DDB_G0290931-like n=1 Tax=Actinia tenebrosa TaxID=6105 RepID=A0A6P8HV93_ACTTE
LVGCDWIGKLQHLTQHRKTCPFQEVQCSHEECNQTVQRRELQHHEKICYFRKVECVICGVVILQHEKDKHIRDDCLQVLICCPNRCIDNETDVTLMIKRLDLEYHIKNTCTKTILDCPFKDQGCSVQVERQHVDKHVQDNMAAHMMLLAKRCSSLTRHILSLTEQNVTLTEQCEALNLRCLSLTQENEDVDEDLSEDEENISDQMFSTFLSCGSYEWTINDFPTLCTKHINGSAFTSPIFWLRGHRLNFLVYPNGIDEEAEGWLSLYLEFSEEYPKSRKIINKIPHVKNTATVICRLSVKSIEPETDDVSQQATHVLKLPGSWGWSEMIKTTEALSTAYCNSTDGSLTIKCKILSE